MTSPSPIIVLDSTLYQDMRWCANCGGEKIFVPVFLIEDQGWLGYCLGCGEEKFAAFTRVTQEAA